MIEYEHTVKHNDDDDDDDSGTSDDTWSFLLFFNFDKVSICYVHVANE